MDFFSIRPFRILLDGIEVYKLIEIVGYKIEFGMEERKLIV